MRREREPHPVAHDRSGEPRADVEDLQDVRARHEVRVGRTHEIGDAGQQLRAQLGRVVGRAHAAIRAVEHRAAVQLIGAGARHHVEEQTALLGDRRAAAARLIVRFLERVRIEIHHGARAVPVEIRDVHAVDQESVLVIAAVDGGRGLQERFRSADVHLAQHDARDHARDGPHVDAIRQAVQHLSRQHCLLQRGGRIEQRRFAGDRDAFLQRADLELEIDARGGIRVHDDVLLRRGAESLDLRLHGVGARDEPEELKCAACVGDGFLVAADAASRVGQRDRRSRQHRTGRVGNGAADRSDALREHRRRGACPQRQRDNDSDEARCSHRDSLLSVPLVNRQHARPRRMLSDNVDLRAGGRAMRMRRLIISAGVFGLACVALVAGGGHARDARWHHQRERDCEHVFASTW